MDKMLLSIVPNEEKLTIDVVQGERVLYSIPCINTTHFYTVWLLVEKKLEGKEIESSILGIKKD
jgi:hypothetical protein